MGESVLQSAFRQHLLSETFLENPETAVDIAAALAEFQLQPCEVLFLLAMHLRRHLQRERVESDGSRRISVVVGLGWTDLRHRNQLTLITVFWQGHS